MKPIYKIWAQVVVERDSGDGTKFADIIKSEPVRYGNAETFNLHQAIRLLNDCMADLQSSGDNEWAATKEATKAELNAIQAWLENEP